MSADGDTSDGKVKGGAGTPLLTPDRRYLVVRGVCGGRPILA